MEKKHSKYVREKELVKGITPFSHTTLWRLARESDSGFPKPIKLSKRITAWDRSAVMAWLDSKAIGASNEPKP